jgi:RNA polymerase primary sigma factor
MHTDYLNLALRELRDQQTRFAPRERKLEQVAAAERLLGEIDPQRAYTYEYLCYRITNYRPEAHREVRMTGEEAVHDLRLLVEDLSDAANVPAEGAGERVLTVEALAAQFNVSTKTISRWRRLGLVSRRFMMDGRKRVGFLESSVTRFVTQNADKVRRGAHFSQLSDREREEIIKRARRLAQAGACPAEVVRRLADKTGRSPETVRYTLKQFDEEHADLAIFPDNHGPIRLETKRRIYQQFHRANRLTPWPSAIAAPGRASTGSWPRCGPSGSWNCRWISSPTSSLPGYSGLRSGRSGSWGQCPPTRSR